MNKIMNKIEKTCVLVVSCDRYRDMWSPFFTLFFRYWPDCPYDIYLCSNEIRYEDKRVKTILTGEDTSWSSNLKRCLERIPSEYVILFQEDFLFTRTVHTEKVIKLSQVIRKHEAACLRLMPSPAPDKIDKEDPCLGEISKGALYRVSLQAAIWEKAELYDLLKDGESPWDFEHIGSGRSDLIDKKFLSINNRNRDTWPFDYFSTAIVQGKWVREAVAICKREGIFIDTAHRQVEPILMPMHRKCIANLRRVKRMLA